MIRHYAARITRELVDLECGAIVIACNSASSNALEGVRRIAAGQNEEDFQIGYLAVNKAGEVGAYAIHPGFEYAQHRDGNNEMVKVASLHAD